jgi:hypothetical protein
MLACDESSVCVLCIMIIGSGVELTQYAPNIFICALPLFLSPCLRFSAFLCINVCDVITRRVTFLLQQMRLNWRIYIGILMYYTRALLLCHRVSVS